ncbi:MAG: TRAP transporter small permease [Bosea sp.]|uniref:TRAP transporter small permease n=1 Tax=Bosea sp. (in: a-proteobacteria) TaxID=1871050 RepID=UPI00239078DE|nr:TRAP transporter small permease [Bosea sp. (in: a-proteobacteria)]MCP4734118.1 TRAP transporter small permease [Bosea sp. (in: a-proteobacteria)]
MQEPVPGVPANDPIIFGPSGRVLLAVAKVLAIIGGLLFVGLVVMSIVSIVGRKLLSAPVPGDVELLQMIAAAASAAFFAYCHLNHGDVKVDFFTAAAPPWVNHALDAFGSLLVGLVGAVLTWRVYVGAIGVREDGETSAILDIPIWWAQIAMVPGFVMLTLAGLYMAARHAQEAARRGEIHR